MMPSARVEGPNESPTEVQPSEQLAPEGREIDQSSADNLHLPLRAGRLLQQLVGDGHVF